MFSYLRKIWKAAPIATTILAAAILFAAFFATRMAVDAIYWNDPARHEQAIAAWMTPGYVAHSWHVPREVVLDAIDAPERPPNGPMSLRELAAYLDVPEADLIERLQTAIAEFQAAGPDSTTAPDEQE